MYGEGLYFNKSNKNIFFGLFNNGEIKKGLCYNLKKNAYYIGKFVNSKKNDDFSIYINYEYTQTDKIDAVETFHEMSLQWKDTIFGETDCYRSRYESTNPSGVVTYRVLFSLSTLVTNC